MSDAQTAITVAQEKAKRQAIIDRVLDWIDQAESVDIVRETPEMERENSYITARMIATGELTIELKLTGLDGIHAQLKNGGDRFDSNDWFAV